MIPELPRINTPGWLAAIGHGDWSPGTPLPLKELLTESLYYPACGLNGTPVKFLAGNVLSFIYADYGVTKEDYLSNLNGHGPDSGFRGYHSIMQREIFREDIMPSGWKPLITPSRPRDIQRLPAQERLCRPFGHWSVWQKNADSKEVDSPNRFSFLYFAGEMSAIYQGLFCRLAIAPKILAIIQPGAMGGEWEGVTSDDSFFKEVVASNAAGMPEYLLYGGFGGGGYFDQPC